MSDDNTAPSEPQTPPEPVQLPPQQTPDDTSNWDDRVSTDPSGDTYIKDPDQLDIKTK